jgi:hypothetical protein
MRGDGVLLLCSALALSVVGCSFATGSRNVSCGDLTEVWIGNLITVRQAWSAKTSPSACFSSNSPISGFYRCWSGDNPCADFNLGGRLVRVRMGSQALARRLRMEDGSSCFFQGVPRSDMKGICTCFTAQRARERGWWHVRRAY